MNGASRICGIDNMSSLDYLASISIFILIVVAVILMISAVVAVRVAAARASAAKAAAAHRRQFCDDFNLSEDDFPTQFEVKITEPVDVATYELDFPYWEYANKDGGMNRRRAGNYLNRPCSVLCIDQYEVRVNDPYDMVQLVNLIRDLNPNVRIKPCREEIAKFNYLQGHRNSRVYEHDLYDLYQTYRNDPYEFETLVADLFRAMGYMVKKTSKTNDGGYDIELYKNGERGIIECKCYEPGSKISRPLVQKLVGANHVIHAEHVIFVATCDYSKEAEEFAKSAGVSLINGQRLMRTIEMYINHHKQQPRISERECRLTRNDLQQYYPPDVYV